MPVKCPGCLGGACKVPVKYPGCLGGARWCMAGGMVYGRHCGMLHERGLRTWREKLAPSPRFSSAAVIYLPGPSGRCATVAESRILPIRPHNTHTHLDPRPRGGQHALPSCRAVPYMHKHSDPAPPFRACCARSGACAVVGVRCSCTHSTAVHAPVAVDVQRGEALPQPLKVDRLHRAAQHGRSLG